MTTLDRLTKRRDELLKQQEQLRTNLIATTGAIQALDEQIAEESKPPPNRAERRRAAKATP